MRQTFPSFAEAGGFGRRIEVDDYYDGAVEIYIYVKPLRGTKQLIAWSGVKKVRMAQSAAWPLCLKDKKFWEDS